MSMLGCPRRAESAAIGHALLEPPGLALRGWWDEAFSILSLDAEHCYCSPGLTFAKQCSRGVAGSPPEQITVGDLRGDGCR